MTEEEWARIAHKIENWWGTPPFDEDREIAYREVLIGEDSSAVETAVRAMLEVGGAFTPTLAQIKAKLVRTTEGPGAPTWTTAWGEIQKAATTYGQNQVAAVIHLCNVHWALGHFANLEGWSRLSTVNIESSYEMNRLKQSYESFAARTNEEELHHRAFTQTSGPTRIDAGAHVAELMPVTPTPVLEPDLRPANEDT